MNNKCFALNARQICTALNNRNCMGQVICPFYKTREQADEGREKANDHLRALPKERQVEIADKYYEGNMSWRESV